MAPHRRCSEHQGRYWSNRSKASALQCSFCWVRRDRSAGATRALSESVPKRCESDGIAGLAPRRHRAGVVFFFLCAARQSRAAGRCPGRLPNPAPFPARRRHRPRVLYGTWRSRWCRVPRRDCVWWLDCPRAPFSRRWRRSRLRLSARRCLAGVRLPAMEAVREGAHLACGCHRDRSRRQPVGAR